MTARLITLFTLLITQAPATTPQQPNGSVEGTVLRSGPEDPLPRAQVLLTRIPPPPAPGQAITAPNPSSIIPPVVTTEDGKFKFDNLADGQYRIRAIRNGFAPQEFGQRAANLQGVPLQLVNGNWSKTSCSILSKPESLPDA